MAQFVIANNVNTQLAAVLPSSGAGSTTVVLASSANLPTLNTSIGQMMPLTLNDAATGAIYETMYVTAISGATLTVLRGQEGTSALNWNVGDLAFCGPTAGTVGLTTMRTQYQASASFSSSQTLTAAIAGESVGFTGTSASVFSMPGQSTVPNLTPTAVYNDGTATLTLTANGSDKFVVATGQVTSIVMQPGDDLTFYASTTANLWTTASGSALRQYEPLVVGAATASQHAVQLGQATGRFLGVQVLTPGSGTFTAVAGTTEIFVRGWAGGSGGGGTSSSSAAGGGGGGGGYFELLTPYAGPTAYTVGAAGVGVSAGTGGAGGSTSYGALATATGGTAGSGGSGSTNGVGGIGGTVSGSGFLNVAGQTGQGGGNLIGGGGGSSFCVGGGLGHAGVGDAGVTPGGGGAGGAGSSASGAGGAGKLVIFQYGTAPTVA